MSRCQAPIADTPTGACLGHYDYSTKLVGQKDSWHDQVNTMRLNIVMLLILLGFCSCGGSDSSTPTSKDLFSSWAEQTGGGASVLDFTGCKFGTQAYAITVAGGKCNCMLAIAGTESAGNLVLNDCSYSGTGTDPGCSSDAYSDKYTITGATLTICHTTDSYCATYD